jgi:2-polyprenyl-3-methyl-5-hydroxy-6-metoxy-1,4-benzoquinol methylase
MIRHRLAHRAPQCPYCAMNTPLRKMARKKLLLDIFECRNCLLIFRWPAETAEEFRRFYQQEYAEGAITELPAAQDLERLCAEGFRGGSLDLSGKIALLRTLENSGRVLDYGCSWGYGLYQLRTSGFDAVGYEISSPRAGYGRAQLGAEIMEDPAALAELSDASFDVLFSNHVVEHLPALGETLDLFSRLLRRGGLAFIVLPNFTGKEARNGRFLNWIGAAHPVAPTRDFFLRNLPQHGFRDVRCFSGPLTDEVILRVGEGRCEELEQDGDELFVLARKS